ncbi:unnamed protein product, partial [Orchesella dallaii]
HLYPFVEGESNSSVFVTKNNPKFFHTTIVGESSLKKYVVSTSTVVKIGIVTCSGPYLNATELRGTNETVTLIKSVIISAKVYNVEEVQFHIFVDSDILQKFLERKISAYSAKIRNVVKIRSYFYSVFKSVPANNVKEFVNSDLPCTYIRIFFPDVLTSIDEILYLDTDVVITGNIAEIWKTFRDMSNNEIVALSPNNEPEDKNYEDIDKGNFGNIPHVLSKGVNAGIFYMNLLGLRKFEWTTKVLDVYRKYIEQLFYMNDQRLINIVLHRYRDILKVMPCNYNFQYLHCEKGLTCKEAVSDPMGIQILHGAGDSFQNETKSHYLIYESFRKFELGRQDEVLDLFTSLKQYYTEKVIVWTCRKK